MESVLWNDWSCKSGSINCRSTVPSDWSQPNLTLTNDDLIETSGSIVYEKVARNLGTRASNDLLLRVLNGHKDVFFLWFALLRVRWANIGIALGVFIINFLMFLLVHINMLIHFKRDILINVHFVNLYNLFLGYSLAWPLCVILTASADPNIRISEIWCLFSVHAVEVNACVKTRITDPAWVNWNAVIIWFLLVQVVVALFTHDSFHEHLIFWLDFHHLIPSEDVLRNDLVDFLFAKRTLVRDVLDPLGDAGLTILMVAAVQLNFQLDRYFVNANGTSLHLLSYSHLLEWILVLLYVFNSLTNAAICNSYTYYVFFFLTKMFLKFFFSSFRRFCCSCKSCVFGFFCFFRFFS